MMKSKAPSYPVPGSPVTRVLSRLLCVTLLLGAAALHVPGFAPRAWATVTPTSEPNYPPPPTYSTPGPAVLTVTTPGGGSVVSTNVGGIVCPGQCAAPYAVGTRVRLSARPSPGYAFAGWSGDGSGTDTTCSVLMDQPRIVGATFLATLTVVVHGPGTVTTSPSGITCGSGGSACSDTLGAGSSVTLTPTPDVGKVFYAWTGACAPDLGAAPCTLTMDGPKQVDAWFGDDVPVQVLTVSLPSDYSPSPGMVTSTPDEVDCRNDTFFGWTGCWGIFPKNSTVSLHSNPFANSFLVQWEGDGSSCGSAADCSILMDTNHSVGARFAKMSQLVLNVHKDPNSAGGSVAVGVPVNYTCDIPVGSNDRTCSWWLPIPSPTAIPLTAQPVPGSTFTWSQACSGSDPDCSPVVGNGNTTTVNISFINHLTINSGSINGGQGQVNISPVGIPAIDSCAAGGTCNITYLDTTTVTLTAQPDGGSSFTWGDNPGTKCFGVQTSDCTFTVYPGQPVTVDAHFYPPGTSLEGTRAPRYVDSASQNRPNPFNPMTEIPYSLAAKGRVRIRIYDVAGRLVRTLLDAIQQAGPHLVQWDGRAEQGRPLASGIYFYAIYYPGGARSVRMMTILR